MVHVFASLAFTLVALGSFALVAFMLLAEQGKILAALGMKQSSAPIATRQYSVRVKTAGRWQSVPAQLVHQQRAAA